jgi:hypothetical protein
MAARVLAVVEHPSPRRERVPDDAAVHQLPLPAS